MALSRFLRAFPVRAAVVMTVALGALAGCATAPAKPEDAVVARAQERWDALVRGDIGKAYGYLSPGSRAVMPLEAYKAEIKAGFWKAAKVQRAECSSAEACNVVAEIEYEYRGSRVKTPLQESWVRQERDWWYVLK